MTDHAGVAPNGFNFDSRSSKLAKAVGQLTLAWGHLEFRFAQLFVRVLQPDSEETGLALYYGLSNLQPRMKAMRDVFRVEGERHLAIAQTAEIWKRVHDRIKDRLAKRRGEIVHGLAQAMMDQDRWEVIDLVVGPDPRVAAEHDRRFTERDIQLEYLEVMRLVSATDEMLKALSEPLDPNHVGAALQRARDHLDLHRQVP